MNNTKQFAALAVAAFIFGISSACQMAGNNNTAANNANKPTNIVVTTPTPEPKPSEPADEAGSPTAAYKAAYAARKDKDIVALKKLMSKDILEFMTMIGSADEKKKKTLDQTLEELCEQPQAATAEARNEKINGDKATIEYLNEDGKWETMDFVKEDGVWKLTIDKGDKNKLEK